MSRSLNSSKNCAALEMVRSLTFEITNRCDLRCRICNIWMEKPVRDLPVDQIQRITASFPNLIGVSLTGGEPLLHPKIDRIYRLLCQRVLTRNLRHIDISTNAYSPAVTQFLRRNAKFLRPLSLSISVDGIDATHTIQRGRADAFRKTLQNLKDITALGVPIMIKFTASSLNYKELPNVARLAKILGGSFHFKIAEELPVYYHRHRSKTPPILTGQQRTELSMLLRQIPASLRTNDPVETFSLRCHRKYLKTGNMAFLKKCRTPADFLFITSHGDIHNCLYQEKIGRIENWPCEISTAAFTRNRKRGLRGTCPKCLAYHGSLHGTNLSRR